MKDKELERLNNEIKQYKEYIKELKDSLINYHIKNNKLINKNEEKDKEIERLNNIINEIRRLLKEEYYQDIAVGKILRMIDKDSEPEMSETNWAEKKEYVINYKD